jgi:hypothetical protein
MTISRSLKLLAPTLLVTSLGIAACTDASITADEESADEQAATPLSWQRAGGRAISIGVSPDDTIWVVGWENTADSNIWYMQVKDVPGELVTEEVWTMTNGRAKRVVVDNGGEPQGITSSGAVLFNRVTTTNVQGQAVFKPGVDWKTVDPQIPRFPCVMDLGVIHRENYLLFQTANRDERDHQYYSLRCPTSRGNGIFMHIQEDLTSQWTPTSQLAKSLAFFAPAALSDQSAGKTPWILDSNGNMWSNDAGGNTFTSKPTTPSLAYGLTDHYALASDGVYEWSDSRRSWTRVIENTTPTGTITQIARSGAVRIQTPSGATATVGPSGLWAIDDSGAIYRAGQSAIIR